MSGESLGAGTVLRSTPKALLVALEDIGEEKWIPRSVIHDDSELYDECDHDAGEVVVKAWWAQKEQLV